MTFLFLVCAPFCARLNRLAFTAQSNAAVRFPTRVAACSFEPKGCHSSTVSCCWTYHFRKFLLAVSHSIFLTLWHLHHQMTNIPLQPSCPLDCFPNIWVSWKTLPDWHSAKTAKGHSILCARRRQIQQLVSVQQPPIVVQRTSSITDPKWSTFKTYAIWCTNSCGTEQVLSNLMCFRVRMHGVLMTGVSSMFAKENWVHPKITARRVDDLMVSFFLVKCDIILDMCRHFPALLETLRHVADVGFCDFANFLNRRLISKRSKDLQNQFDHVPIFLPHCASFVKWKRKQPRLDTTTPRATIPKT